MLAVAVVSRDVTAAPKGEATLSRRLSHRQITPTARSGRVPVAEHRVESSFRCLNSYGRDLVSQSAFERGVMHTFDEAGKDQIGDHWTQHRAQIGVRRESAPSVMHESYVGEQ